MTRPRAVFFGTPDFAATVLRRLLAADSPVEIAGVVTQPDRPVGRSARPVPPAVKVLAAEHGLPVLQPLAVRRPAFLTALQRLRPKLGILAAYGRILPPDVLAAAPHGFLNVHASLLPRWRGAWPVGAAIMAGDTETGVSIMRMDEGMDTGPVLTQRAEPIDSHDTTATLEPRLAALGAELLVQTIPGYLTGQVTARPQDDRRATYCTMVRKADGLIDWRKPATALEPFIRAMQPWPVAWTTWEGKQLRILAARPVPQGGAPPTPGLVVPHGKGAAVVTGAGLLALEQVQLEGRSAVPVAAFVNGYRRFLGSHLGD
ncbi:MAG TPA: methionyl-tRNA formyltransferase [Chloroflexota bacterium]|nr:methionyl-tRNA formyltransferase [Chloroflexota bacterium]